MKRCPQCNAEYFDDMLEFCLEDGAKLDFVSRALNETPTITKSNKTNPFTEKTVSLPFDTADKTIESLKSDINPTSWNKNPIIKKKLDAGYKILEILPLIFSLSHNWWQWLYAANQSYSTVSAFLLSANFLIWLLLLAIGTGLSVLAFKRCENKGYALISLVILAINLILFIVPKR